MVFHVSIWGDLELRLGGISPQKPPRGDGTAQGSQTQIAPRAKRGLNTFTSGRNREFSHQNNRIARGFAREFLRSRQRFRPSKRLKRRGKSSSLHSKIIFCVRILCEWRHKWSTFRPPWPTSPGPGRQPFHGSISLDFLLETRLQSEPFDTLDDLLGFRVQKLWSKVTSSFKTNVERGRDKLPTTRNTIRRKKDVKAVSSKAQVPPLLRQRHNAAQGSHTVKRACYV